MSIHWYSFPQPGILLNFKTGQYSRRTLWIPLWFRRKQRKKEEHPLFDVAGMFEIDMPGWIENIDELLGEAYLDAHETEEVLADPELMQAIREGQEAPETVSLDEARKQLNNES